MLFLCHLFLALAFRNFERMRRDSLVMDELTGEKYILNIYSFCGADGIFEYADGGDIEQAIFRGNRLRARRRRRPDHLSQLDKLHMGTFLPPHLS